jgi:cell division protein FtsL
MWESEYDCSPALSLILQNQFTTSMVMKKMEQEVKKLSAVIYVLIAILIAAVLTLITLILS